MIRRLLALLQVLRRYEEAPETHQVIVNLKDWVRSVSQHGRICDPACLPHPRLPPDRFEDTPIPRQLIDPLFAQVRANGASLSAPVYA